MRLSVTTLILLLNCCVIAWAQHGVNPNWTSKVELPVPPQSNSAGGFLYSNMAALSSGKRIVMIQKKEAGGGVFFTYSNDGTTWSTPELFAASSFVIGLNSPKLISDNNDNLHMIWASQAPKALFYTKMDAGFNFLEDSVRIAENPDFNNYNGMYITVDGKGRIHVMWHEGDQNKANETAECYYSRSLDGGRTWSARTRLSVDDGISSAFPRAQFNAYTGDNLAIFWRDSSTVASNDWDVQMVTSTNGGSSWSQPVTINQNTNYQGDPDLVIDPEGRFHLFYHEAPVNDPYWGMRVHYGYSDDQGATWKPSTSFKNVVSREQRSYLVEASRYDIANGVLWTFWKEEDLLGLQGGDMLATYSLDRGLSWAEPEYVTDHSDTTIGFKSIVLLPDGGLATNYELPNYPEAGLLRVFYKERSPLVILGQNILERSDKLILYPNPTMGELKISLNYQYVHKIEIINLYGQMLVTRPVNGSELQIDVSHLKAGTYFVKMQTSMGITTQRFVKQ